MAAPPVAAAPPPAVDDLPRVRRPRWGRWVGAALVLVALGFLVRAFAEGKIAWDVVGQYLTAGAIMRGLVMDFPADPRVRDIATEYLFGPAFLVAPVYEQGARRRDVYLPAAADWYDFYTGEKYRGGSAVAADAPLSRMPLFVRAGSIVPTGPAIRHTGESLNAPLTLLVYTGADGAFDLYEDDGTTYDYEQGEWSRIPFRYDESSGVLTIGQRIGGFDEMAHERRIAVRWIDGADPHAADFDAEPDATLTYRGEPLAVQRR